MNFTVSQQTNKINSWFRSKEQVPVTCQAASDRPVTPEISVTLWHSPGWERVGRHPYHPCRRPHSTLRRVGVIPTTACWQQSDDLCWSGLAFLLSCKTFWSAVGEDNKEFIVMDELTEVFFFTTTLKLSGSQIEGTQSLLHVLTMDSLMKKLSQNIKIAILSCKQSVDSTIITNCPRIRESCDFCKQVATGRTICAYISRASTWSGSRRQSIYPQWTLGWEIEKKCTFHWNL